MKEQERQNSAIWLKQIESSFGALKYVLSLLSFIEIISYGGFIYFLCKIVAAMVPGSQSTSNFINTIPFLILFISIRSIAKFLNKNVAYNLVLLSREQIQKQLLESIGRKRKKRAHKVSPNTYSSVFVESIEATEGYFGKFIPQKIEVLIFGISILSVIGYYNFFCAIILILTIPTIPVFAIIIGKGVVDEQKRHYDFMADIGAYFVDRLQGMPTLKRFGYVESETTNIKKLSIQYNKGLFKILDKAFLSGGFIEFFASASIATIAIYIGLSLTGYITLGQYPASIDYFVGLFILLLVPEFYKPLQKLSTLYHDKQEALGAAGHLLQYIDVNPNSNEDYVAEDSNSQKPLAHSQLLMNLNGISFKYTTGSAYVLRDFSLDIYKKEWLGIQGPSGCGKSTLALLVMDVLRPDLGTITRSTGYSISDGLQIGWVQQKPEILFGSIAANIALSKNPNRQKVRRLIEDFKICTFVNFLPSGMNTLVGPGGHKLSCGQEQQINIARALFRKPDILILDEPFAHLDETTSKKMLNTIRFLKNKHTIVQISHDHKFLKYTDRTVTLKSPKDGD